MPTLPEFVRADAATLALIVQATVTGELPRTSYDEAWDAWPGGPERYAPTKEVEEWVRDAWPSVSGMSSPEIVPESVKLEAGDGAITEVFSPFSHTPFARLWMKPFLEKFAACGVKTEAALACRIDPSTPKKSAKVDPLFAAALEVATEMAGDTLLAAFRKRAVDGWEEPVFGRMDTVQGGKVICETVVVGHVRKFSDALLARGLVAFCPEFAKQAEGAGGVNVQVNASANASASATAVAIASPEKLKSIQERNRLQLEKQTQRSVKAAGGNN